MSPSAQAEQWPWGAGCTPAPHCAVPCGRPAGQGPWAPTGWEQRSLLWGASCHRGRGGPRGEKGRIPHCREEVELLPWS